MPPSAIEWTSSSDGSPAVDLVTSVLDTDPSRCTYPSATPGGGVPPRLVARLRNATACPSPLKDGVAEAALPALPLKSKLMPKKSANGVA